MCSTNLECCVEHNQFGARGDNVVALVGFHKAHVNITLGFSSCRRKKKQENTLRGRQNLPGEKKSNGNKHTQSPNNHYGPGPLYCSILVIITPTSPAETKYCRSFDKV